MGLDEEAAQLSKGGGAFILEWFTSIFYGDSQSAHATNKILQEVGWRVDALCRTMLAGSEAAKLAPAAVARHCKRGA